MSADLQLLIGKILTEEGFAQSLAENPEKALKDAKIEPTVDLLDALAGVDPESLKNLASSFGAQQAAV
ncbi:MAG: response regulator transcription factor [Anaerolineaceae bacterium]|nr:response regulator transcription factor [Anaerolineaceae bacterium]MCB9098341.1 response regulator transcription factor [Anaerolineales bacterium]